MDTFTDFVEGGRNRLMHVGNYEYDFPDSPVLRPTITGFCNHFGHCRRPHDIGSLPKIPADLIFCGK